MDAIIVKELVKKCVEEALIPFKDAYVEQENRHRALKDEYLRVIAYNRFIEKRVNEMYYAYEKAANQKTAG